MSGPLVLGHRGASAVRPELTEAALHAAIEQGADGIEIDVVPSRDGHLVLRHDRALAATTDIVHRTGRDRRVDDLPWADLDVLRARERWPELRARSARFDGREPLLRLPDAMRIAEQADVLLVVEIKDATAFAAAGSDPVPLVARDLAGTSARIVLESFEKTPLRALAHLGHPLFYLLDAHGSAPDEATGYIDELADPGRLSGFDGVSLPLELVTEQRVGALHDADLQVWAWTLRAENAFLPAGLRIGRDPAAPGDWRARWSPILDAGVDAVFADDPALALALRADRGLTPAGGGGPSRRSTARPARARSVRRRS